MESEILSEMGPFNERPSPPHPQKYGFLKYDENFQTEINKNFTNEDVTQFESSLFLRLLTSFYELQAKTGLLCLALWQDTSL